MSHRWIFLSSTLVGGAACIAAAVYMYKRRQWKSISEFVLIGKVSQLTIYPVKSMKGVNVEEMECEETGGKYKELKDRHFILMDEDTGKLVTGRQFPKLLATSADVHGGTLFLTCEGRTFELNIEEVIRRNEVKRAVLHDGLKQEGLDCGNQITEFLRLILETSNNLRVLYFTKNVHIERDGLPEQGWHFGPEGVDTVAYPDDCPYMTICESSVDDLNSRLLPTDRVDMRYFRPVIQISGPPAYDEDMWSELKIEGVVLGYSIPCSRCVLVTIDPDKGTQRQNNQPLKLLREYRLAPAKFREIFHQNPIFGIFMAVKNKGTIRVGDLVYARYKNHCC